MKFDVIVIGAGKSGMTAAQSLKDAGLKVAVIAAGSSVSQVSTRRFENGGGIVLHGDSVAEGVFDNEHFSSVIFETGLLKAVKTVKLGDYPLEADYFVLASGKFLGGGITVSMGSVRESVFDLDVAAAPDRAEWFDADFQAPQPFLGFGVRVDELSRPSRGGAVVSNLFACGEVLEGVSVLIDPAEIEKSAGRVVANILKLRADAGE